MALDPSFKSIIQQIFQQTIDYTIKRMNISDDLVEKQDWKYENSFDFHYGRTIGLITRIIREEFKRKYGMESSPQETLEIIAIMKENSLMIRHALAFLKDRQASED